MPPALVAMPTAPEGFLNRALLRQLAGERLFASGEQCFASGQVAQVRVAKERVSARVTGSSTYRVKLWRRRGELLFRCDCAVGQADAFCKHCVAVGLAWLSRSEPPAAPASGEPSRGKPAATKQEEARREEERRRLAVHLGTLGRARLAKLLLEATDFDEILRRRMLLEALGIAQERPRRSLTSRPTPRPDFDAYRRLLREAARPTGYVDYHAMPDYAQGVEEAIAPLKELLRAGWHDEIIALAEFVLTELDAASDRVDTGDALLNRVYDDLQRLHLDACRAGRPRVSELAARLLHYELEGGLGIFNNAARTYADILGKEGLAAWQSLLIREWKNMVGGIGPGRQNLAPPALLIDHRRFQAQMLMERMAADEGNLEALLALKRADLCGVHDHIALAERLAAAGRHDQAILCAEQAAGQFGEPAEKSVWRGFLIAAYQRAGRQEEARRLAWEQFAEIGDVERFRELKAVVLSDDSADWSSWRERALGRVRQLIDDASQSDGVQARMNRFDGSKLVELQLEEGLDEAAWETARLAGCRNDLWLVLAGRREAEHPLDAVAVCQRQIDALLSTGAGGYREALELIARLRALFKRARRAEDYLIYLKELRAAQRQKRGFLRLLNAVAA